MTKDAYTEWTKSPKSGSRGKFLKGEVDDIVIMGIPTGPRESFRIEGFVVQSGSEQFPVGYASLGWSALMFEFIDGGVEFTKHTPLNVTVADGKYTVRQDELGRLTALRHGEPWRDCCGDGLIYALAAEVAELREKLTLQNTAPTS